MSEVTEKLKNIAPLLWDISHIAQYFLTKGSASQAKWLIGKSECNRYGYFTQCNILSHLKSLINM